jgi:hypothetical protein
MVRLMRLRPRGAQPLSARMKAAEPSSTPKAALAEHSHRRLSKIETVRRAEIREVFSPLGPMAIEFLVPLVSLSTPSHQPWTPLESKKENSSLESSNLPTVVECVAMATRVGRDALKMANAARATRRRPVCDLRRNEVRT